MSELIYKQDAIDLVKEVCDAIMSGCDSHYDPETEDEVYNDILEVDAILKCNKEIRIALANLPSAEPEIIRCRDCKHYTLEVGDDSYALGYCPFIGSHLVMSKGFCAWGERRT